MYGIRSVIANIVTLLTSYVFTYSHVMESFLPSLINVRPVIQMRRFNNIREPHHTNLIELTNFTYIIYPDSCGECNDGLLLVVIIHSYVANFANRKTIRNTWGRSTKCIKVLFFIGTTYDNSIMKWIISESREHADIVQGKLEDIYRNLPYKHIMALKWVKLFCPKVKYVLKTDSDVIVRLNKLYELLKKDLWGSTKLIAGHIEYKEKVLREESSSFTNRKVVSETEYPEMYYPPYCWGQFVLYSADVVFDLLKESSEVPYFKLEDIYVTGILAKHITEIRHVNLVPHWYLSKTMLTNYTEEIAKEDYVYGPYSLNLEEMREFWKLMSKYEEHVVHSSPKPKVIILLPSVKPTGVFKATTTTNATIKANSSKSLSLKPKIYATVSSQKPKIYAKVSSPQQKKNSFKQKSSLKRNFKRRLFSSYQNTSRDYVTSIKKSKTKSRKSKTKSRTSKSKSTTSSSKITSTSTSMSTIKTEVSIKTMTQSGDIIPSYYHGKSKQMTINKMYVSPYRYYVKFTSPKVSTEKKFTYQYPTPKTTENVFVTLGF